MRRRQIQNFFFIAVVLLTTVAFVGLIRNFLQPVFWAAVLATIFHPTYQWWQEKTGQRDALASVLTLLTIVLIVILPLFFVGLAVAREASLLYERIASGEINLQAGIQYLEGLVPLANDFLARFGVDLGNLQERLSNAAVSASRTIASQALAFGQNAFRIGVLFFLMLYLLFFFFRDGHRLLRAAVSVLPLGDARERRLLRKFAEVAQATIKGTIVVGLVQGTLGGVIFWLLGINAAILWGVVMAVLSFLPAVGAAVVWVPAAIVLIISGSTLKGVLLLGFGSLIIGLADNVLRPVLVGRETQMPDYLVLIATLGGLTLFGVSGFVIGPIIAALFLTVWDMFGEEFGTDPSIDRPFSDSPAAPASGEETADVRPDDSPEASSTPDAAATEDE